MDLLTVAILFSLLTLGVSAPWVSLDPINLLFTNSLCGEAEMRLRMIEISLRERKTLSPLCGLSLLHLTLLLYCVYVCIQTIYVTKRDIVNILVAFLWRHSVHTGFV